MLMGRRPAHWFFLSKFAFSEGKIGHSFYRRTIPKQLTVLDTPEGKQIFKEGLLEGHCQAFFTWIQQFITQNEVSTCSSASMAMMLNTLKVDPGINWKGIWRWYDDYNIKSMDPELIMEGLTLQQFHNLAHFNSVRSMAFSPLEGRNQEAPPSIKKSSLQVFRNCVKACTSSQDILLTVNFHRKSLGQTGTGHYSPVAAFNATRDMALVLDVAKFKYDSYWCKLDHLYAALKPLDLISGQSRGYIINKKLINYNSDLPASQQYECVALKGLQPHKKLDMLIMMLNNQSNHSFLISLLYDYTTCTIQNFDQMLQFLSLETTFRQAELYLQIKKLNNEAFTLLSAFQRNSINSILQLLYLILSINNLMQFKEVVRSTKPHADWQSFFKFLVYLKGNDNLSKLSFPSA